MQANNLNMTYIFIKESASPVLGFTKDNYVFTSAIQYAYL